MYIIGIRKGEITVEEVSLMAKNQKGEDRTNDLGRFAGISKEYDFETGALDTAVPQSQRKSDQKK
ncbi:Uncharacterised protein [Mycobacteroides abscessus subsp. abscessus]|nr:hypothetical protein B14911_25125 [Bacillus sp. NRRL B-14911]SIE50960.1 Uncharacterised protein [Mycobacteroides abscessus subsp. abscessus]